MLCIKQCISLFLKSTLSEQEKGRALKKMEQLLVEHFEVIEKWLNKTLRRRLTQETDKELKVGITHFLISQYFKLGLTNRHGITAS